jgi:N-acetylglucosaminyldiphosphoundecaprenol N-acetyl-beta-D-mannosaminyltransferase
MRSATILGVRVDAIDAAGAVRRIVELAHGSEPSVVVTLGTEMAVRARRDPELRDAVNNSALSLCDTIGILLAARWQGVALSKRVAGVDLIEPLCAALAWEGQTLYLLGGRGDTAKRAAAALGRSYPNLVVAGARDGYFTEAQAHDVAAAIRATGARVLLAGLGSPRQELWLSRHLAATGCTVGIGVGGSFDVLAGNVRRAPLLFRKAGLEWLYRLGREPWRWRRQLALPVFVALALRERLFSNSPQRFVA